MGSKMKPFVSQIQAEGTLTERRLEREELMKEARKLADKIPTFGPDRLVYVRNLTTKALRKEIDLDVFKAFIKMTGSWAELQTCLPRVRLIVGKDGLARMVERR